MPLPTEMTVPQLTRLIGTPECPVLIDVRLDEDIAADPRLIPGATRHPHADIAALVPRLAGRRVLLVCQRGLKLSVGAAALLRTHGVPAETLEGGTLAWAEAGAPMIHILPGAGPLWVTRARPKIDRIACPWLIRRFVDPDARFLFVAAGQVAAVAERFAATPFDIEGVPWSHRGDRCTFDTMLAEYGPTLPALDHMATIIRAADTDRHDLAPQAAGLLAISLGLSRMHRDDLAMPEAAMPVHDALYRWCRDAVDEGHGWPAGAGA